MHRLIEQVIRPEFGATDDHDGAVFDIGGARLAFTTDSYVVRPLFFPGGDIGSLAVHGTDAYRDAIEATLAIARDAAARIEAAPHLELVEPQQPSDEPAPAEADATERAAVDSDEPLERPDKGCAPPALGEAGLEGGVVTTGAGEGEQAQDHRPDGGSSRHGVSPPRATIRPVSW